MRYVAFYGNQTTIGNSFDAETDSEAIAYAEEQAKERGFLNKLTTGMTPVTYRVVFAAEV